MRGPAPPVSLAMSCVRSCLAFWAWAEPPPGCPSAGLRVSSGSPTAPLWRPSASGLRGWLSEGSEPPAQHDRGPWHRRKATDTTQR
jgi:hypothetical protein